MTSAHQLGVEEVVARLRDLRNASLQQRHRDGRPPKLPSREAITEIVGNLSAAMFPNRLGRPDLTDEGIDHYVGNLLDVALHALNEQLRRELLFVSNLDGLSQTDADRAASITREFARSLPRIRELLDTDILAAYQGDPAARSVDEVLICYPGVTAIAHYRMANVLYRLGVPLTARMIAELAHSLTGIDIHPGAQIGERFFIDHGTGVVIGETAIIGNNVRLYQAVTLGAKRFPAREDGSLVKGEPRHPIVEDDVVIYAGATVLGRVTIGRGSTIGGNVWLTRSVPPGSNVSQAQTTDAVIGSGSGK
ncbi:MAG: serine acetyltransferase [Burkholderiaceae bacterium]|nr:serine acetyltransferase [Burkholderiaceae bacterium]